MKENVISVFLLLVERRKDC